jgi:hypothetical protein
MYYFRCQRSMSVDKQEHEESRMLVCPLPDCTHVWCKSCQQSFTIGGPPHSCDGTSELDHLMKQRGWKYCPSMYSWYCAIARRLLSLADCKTPVQRDGGCSHMTVRESICRCIRCPKAYICCSAFRLAATLTFATFVAGSSFAVPCEARSRARYLLTIVFVVCLSIPLEDEALGVGGEALCEGRTRLGRPMTAA